MEVMVKDIIWINLDCGITIHQYTTIFSCRIVEGFKISNHLMWTE